MDQLVSILEASIAKLPANKKDFAASLCAQWRKKNFLSEKQAPWVSKLIEIAEGTDVLGLPSDVQLSSMAALIEWFKKAGAKLKYPQIDIKTKGGTELEVYIAGVTSKYCGQVIVRVVPPKWELKGKVWAGHVTLDGAWTPSKNVDDKLVKEISRLLQELADAPAKTAAAYGKMMGRCVFCKKALTDDKALAVGYGAKCASNWNLPWGKKAAEEASKALAFECN